MWRAGAETGSILRRRCICCNSRITWARCVKACRTITRSPMKHAHSIATASVILASPCPVIRAIGMRPASGSTFSNLLTIVYGVCFQTNFGKKAVTSYHRGESWTLCRQVCAAISDNRGSGNRRRGKGGAAWDIGGVGKGSEPIQKTELAAPSFGENAFSSMLRPAGLTVRP